MNLSCYERYSKCWWYCFMVNLPLKGDLVFMVNFWLKIFIQKVWLLRDILNHMGSYDLQALWFGYYTWIIGLCQFCKKTFSQESEREIIGKRKIKHQGNTAQFNNFGPSEKFRQGLLDFCRKKQTLKWEMILWRLMHWKEQSLRNRKNWTKSMQKESFYWEKRFVKSDKILSSVNLLLFLFP